LVCNFSNCMAFQAVPVLYLLWDMFIFSLVSAKEVT
jgi:hypothetical protein